jgi:hypothetical protein
VLAGIALLLCGQQLIRVRKIDQYQARRYACFRFSDRMNLRTLVPACTYPGRARHLAEFFAVLLLAGGAIGCSAGKSSSPPSSLPPPAPQVQCAPAGPANPAGGGGLNIAIDSNVYGTADVSGLTVFGFSQQDGLAPPDPQVMELLPNIVPRAWQRWDRGGLQPSDWNFSYPAAAQAAGIKFIGGTTATVLFSDEPNFSQVVSCNAQGQPVVHAPLNFYRGSMASPTYRQYIISIGETQIDGGVDGIFFDEVDQSFEGSTYGEGNEGFDDADVADFGGFLCGKYPGYQASDWAALYGITPADKLDCTISADQRGRGFNYRGYLARNGWQTSPLTGTNPLAVEWGTFLSGHPEPASGNFIGTYTSLVYWQDIVLSVRNYARQKYGREILITANGIFPFVDFQMNGLWDGNPDGPNGASVDYAPLTSDGHLNGTVSLLQAFLSMKQRSLRIAGRAVPVAAFIDWPTGVMTRYFSMPLQDRKDYWRMYTAEAYAASIYLSLHLADTIGDPTAQQLGMMPLFDQLSSFYKAHAALYHNATDLMGKVAVSVPNITTNLTQLPDGTRIAHLINHNYSQGFQTQANVLASFPVTSAPTSVTLVSPDYSADTPVTFGYANGVVHVTVPQLIASVSVVAK